MFAIMPRPISALRTWPEPTPAASLNERTVQGNSSATLPLRGAAVLPCGLACECSGVRRDAAGPSSSSPSRSVDLPLRPLSRSARTDAMSARPLPRPSSSRRGLSSCLCRPAGRLCGLRCRRGCRASFPHPFACARDRPCRPVPAAGRPGPISLALEHVGGELEDRLLGLLFARLGRRRGLLHLGHRGKAHAGARDAPAAWRRRRPSFLRLSTRTFVARGP